jgi:hypothetical protein
MAGDQWVLSETVTPPFGKENLPGLSLSGVCEGTFHMERALFFSPYGARSSDNEVVYAYCDQYR